MEINRIIENMIEESVDEINHELKKEIGHILFAKICIERFLEKLGETNG